MEVVHASLDDANPPPWLTCYSEYDESVRRVHCSEGGRTKFEGWQPPVSSTVPEIARTPIRVHNRTR